MRYYFPAIIFIMAMIICFPSCKPDDTPTSKLAFSTELVTFDTVFTTIGSATRRFVVRNPNNTSVKIDARLAGGKNSSFSMNVDGIAGTEIKGVEIAPKDSIFVHVKVTINPGNVNTPFLITDSIIFRTGNYTQDVDLVAYGQDANFILADTRLTDYISYKIVAGEHESVVWDSPKPYVIYGYALIDSTGSLEIRPGTKVYVHRNGGIWVYKGGNIRINGTSEQPVTFKGDRLEAWYDTDYAQWDKIWINDGSQDNIIHNAIISNAASGIHLQALGQHHMGNKTVITNTIVQNAARDGITAQGSKLQAVNCQISNTGGCGLRLEVGVFDIKQVTVANYFRQSTRQNPAVYISNRYTGFDGMLYNGETTASFANSIIYGSLDRELIFGKYNNGMNVNTTFENCIIKTDSNITVLPNFINCMRNTDPKFVDYMLQNFELQGSSPAIDAGKTGLTGPYIDADLLGRPRNGNPDIGAYEY